MKPNGRNILHVLPSLHEAYGGPLRLVLDLSARAESSGFSSQVLGIGPLVAQDNPLDASRIHSVPSDGGGAYAYSPELRPWLRRRLPDFDGAVLHGAWTYPGWAAAVECRRAGVPYAYYPHGMLESWAVRGQGFAKASKKLVYWLYREQTVMRNARCTFFTTQREQECTREVFRISSPARILRPYGLDPIAAHTERPTDQSLYQPPDRRIALFLGRLHPKKNVDFLLRAWHAAGMAAPWRLMIAGSGEAVYAAGLRRLVERLAIQETVQFTGFVAGMDKSYLLQRADWFLLPSSQENFGIAVLEAIQQGCSVAISEGVYLAESFRPESEVLPLRLDAWEQFLRTRMQDPAWRRHVCEEDHAHLMKIFCIDGIVQQWTEAFLDLFPRRV